MKITMKIASLAIAAVTIAGLAGCTRTVYVHSTPTPSSSDQIAIPDGPDPVTQQTEDTTFDYADTNPDVTLKTTGKQCFGDAGCNLTVKVSLEVDNPDTIPSTATGEVTYEIDGGTDGPIIDTLQLTGSQYQGQSEVVQTPSTNTKLTVKVTDVTTDSQ
jgi:hypothetical protein